MEQQTLLLLIKGFIGIVILLMIVFGALAFIKQKNKKKQEEKRRQLKKKKQSIKKNVSSGKKKSDSNVRTEKAVSKNDIEKDDVNIDNHSGQKAQKKSVSEDVSKSKSVKKDDIVGETVLIVDDSSTARKMLERNLSEKSYQVKTAVDGKDALNQIKKSRPDLVITDIEMPNMDGFELLKNIRSNLSTSGIPVIMITANLDVDIEIGEKNGANGFLRKPYDKDDLTEQVEFLLNF